MAEDPRLTNILKLLFPGGASVDTASAEANNPSFNVGITGQPMDYNAKPIFSETVDTGTAPIIRNSIPAPVPDAPAAPAHQNFLQRLFGNLTKTGVQDTGGKQKFYNDPSQAGVALAQGMRPAAQVSDATLPDQIDSTAGPGFTAPPTPMLPHIFRPSFQDAATDEAGNVRRKAPGLTKGTPF